ncbi:geranylgeranyl reductase family protein [Patescibacteria group bacterium]
MPVYDVIIVGAGPAGSTAAYYLRGKKVLIIDKENFPRYKACGGGLLNSRDWVDEFENFEAIRDKLKYLSVEKGRIYLDRTFLFSRNTHFFDQIDRAEFDHLLLAVACHKRNVEFRKFQVRKIERAREYVIISDGQEKIRARQIVGADGAHSIVSRFLGNKPYDKNQCAPCVGLEIECEKILQVAHISFLWAKGIGFAWVFPTLNGYNIGLGYARGMPLPSKKYLENFIAFCTRQKIIPADYQIRQKFAGIDPLHVPQQWCDEQIFLTGDALGLVYQYNGEGIYFAMKSGKILGQVLSEGNENTAERYREKIKPVIKRVRVTSWIPYRWLTVPFFWIAFSLIRIPWPWRGQEKLHDLCVNIFLRRLDLPNKSCYRKLGD